MYYHNLVNNCPQANHKYYGEYLERHAAGKNVHEEFVASGQICLKEAHMENPEVELKQEHIFLISGKEHLFTPNDNGTTTCCDFAGVGMLFFYKEAPPKDLSLISEMKCGTGDFCPTCNCSMNLAGYNIFACSDMQYVINDPMKYKELETNVQEQLKSLNEKFEVTCDA